MNIVKTFDWRGQTITIDLTPFGSAGSTMGATDRAERAADLLNQLTYLRAEYVHDHEHAKRVAGQRYDAAMAAGQLPGKPSATGRNNFIHEDDEYLVSRVIRDFLDHAWQVMKDVHCPRVNRREGNENRIVSHQVPSPAMDGIPPSGGVPSSVPGA